MVYKIEGVMQSQQLVCSFCECLFGRVMIVYTCTCVGVWCVHVWSCSCAGIWEPYGHSLELFVKQISDLGVCGSMCTL